MFKKNRQGFFLTYCLDAITKSGTKAFPFIQIAGEKIP